MLKSGFLRSLSSTLIDNENLGCNVFPQILSEKATFLSHFCKAMILTVLIFAYKMIFFQSILISDFLLLSARVTGAVFLIDDRLRGRKP